MFKKIIVIFMAIFIISCGLETPGNQDSQKGTGTVTSAENNEKTAEPEAGILSDIGNFAFRWLLKFGLLFNKKTIFTIDYYQGYNLNFKITDAQARALLPANITPVKIKIVENEPAARYYLSWYLAVMNNDQSSEAINRVDIFTYGRDQNGELCLYFVSSIMQIPKSMEDSAFILKQYKFAMEFFARNNKTGEPSYPHYFTKILQANGSTFKVQYENSLVEITNCPPVTTNERLSRDFVMANSQIYRNAIDRNVNFFNQSFIDAKVETRNLNCFTYKNLEGFHPMLKRENLVSIQFYGSKDKKITWYFEM